MNESRNGAARRRKAFSLLTIVAMAAAIAIPPWLALREARRQAYEVEAGIVLAYARDVLHRADETGRQARAGIDAMRRSGLIPCSPQARDLMRRIDLASSYLQAIGHVRDKVLDCSSLGLPPLPLGQHSYTTPAGVVFHTDVAVPEVETRLLAIEQDGFAVLVDHGLPLDIWTRMPGISLAVLNVDLQRVSVARGYVDPGWLGRLGRDATASFSDGRYLVGMARSSVFRSVAVAAVPVAELERQTRAAELRLVPAGVLSGLAVAAALLLLARRQRSLKAALQNALRGDEFFLQYQPLFDLDSGACVGAEALLRWRRPTGELVGPDVFIPIAEQTGLIGKLTHRVIELAARDAGAFLAAHPGFHIALNLSADDLRTPAILAALDDMLSNTGAGPSNLVVEVTERSFIDLDVIGPIVAAIRQRGIKVAIDDFGTGYSSLSVLEALDLDYLKIDRSFIESIGTGAPTSQVVGHIIDLAATLDMRLIAEGIENREQAEFLRRRGVHFVQGWLYAKAGGFEVAAGLHLAGLQARSQG
jgi:sensor c-di-GMP phosphodiesterase-like protein